MNYIVTFYAFKSIVSLRTLWVSLTVIQLTPLIMLNMTVKLDLNYQSGGLSETWGWQCQGSYTSSNVRIQPSCSFTTVLECTTWKTPSVFQCLDWSAGTSTSAVSISGWIWSPKSCPVISSWLSWRTRWSASSAHSWLVSVSRGRPRVTQRFDIICKFGVGGSVSSKCCTCFYWQAPLGLQQAVWWSSTDCHRLHLETFGI